MDTSPAPVVRDTQDGRTIDREHYATICPEGWEYPDPICMECGKECLEFVEEVDTGFGGPYEQWNYCPDCNVQTFHPRRKIKANEHSITETDR